MNFCVKYHFFIKFYPSSDETRENAFFIVNSAVSLLLHLPQVTPCTHDRSVRANESVL